VDEAAEHEHESPAGRVERVPVAHRPGLRIGPMVFVPEIVRTQGDDPWAHRKGEPRPFALLWAMYLLISAGATIFAVRPITVPTQWQFIYACRAMVVMIMIGITVLWPLVRLSQRAPDRRVFSMVIDALIVLVPASVVLAPMTMLTRWPYEIVVGLGASVWAWGLLVAALVLLGTRAQAHTMRALVMVVCLGLGLAGPTLIVLLPMPAGALWLSPYTAVFQITASPPGLTPHMTSDEWLRVLGPIAAAVVVLALDVMLSVHIADSAEGRRT